MMYHGADPDLQAAQEAAAAEDRTCGDAETDEARWQERLKALAAYREAGNDWPRHKAAIAGQEQELGVWVHLQRSKLHRGELDSAKEQALDQAVPGWREGRQRGQTVRAAGLSSR